MNINGTFRFHNVGQGLFYSGILNKKAKRSHATFSFVYDCGTYSSMAFLKSEIDSFKQLLPEKGKDNKKKIDLLVISHLHDDHVNGLEYLLNDVDVDTVVMPYVNDGLKSLPLVESSGSSDFLRTFYLDPAYWFSLMGVHRVLFLGAEDMEQKKENIPSERPLNNNESDLQVNSESVIHTDSISQTSIIYLRSCASASCSKYCWEFKFENLQLDPTVIAAYKSIIDAFIIKYKNLRNILVSEKYTQELRKEIKKRCGNILNRTSVVFLHRPIANKVIAQLHMCDCCVRRYLKPIRYNVEDSYNTALTGDVELKKKESFKILPSDPTKHRYLVVQFPHHGARKNENINYFSNLPAITMVLSYGITNKYGHPHGEVLSRLKRFSLVNERQAFDYQISVF